MSTPGRLHGAADSLRANHGAVLARGGPAACAEYEACDGFHLRCARNVSATLLPDVGVAWRELDGHFCRLADASSRPVFRYAPERT